MSLFWRWPLHSLIDGNFDDQGRKVHISETFQPAANQSHIVKPITFKDAEVDDDQVHKRT